MKSKLRSRTDLQNSYSVELLCKGNKLIKPKVTVVASSVDEIFNYSKSIINLTLILQGLPKEFEYSILCITTLDEDIITLSN